MRFLVKLDLFLSFFSAKADVSGVLPCAQRKNLSRERGTVIQIEHLRLEASSCSLVPAPKWGLASAVSCPILANGALTEKHENESWLIGMEPRHEL